MANRMCPTVLRSPAAEKERERIERVPFCAQQFGAYLRKILIRGYIIYTDTADIKIFTAELSAIGQNINQIAKRLNAGAQIYQADIDEIKARLEEIQQLQRHIL